MEECAEASQDFECGGSPCGAIEGLEESCGGADEKVVLVCVALEGEAAVGGILCEGGEIDMGCDVFLTWIFQRGLIPAVLCVAGQRAARAVRGEELAPGHSVVDSQKKSLAKALGEIADQLVLVAAEFRSVAIRAWREVNALDRMWGWLEGKTEFVGVDLQFMPRAVARLQNVEGQGIEQFVGKMNSIEGM